jgi:hypothetical protein
MSNTIRIRTTPNGSDKYLKVKLEQDFDFIEILSLKISQEDTYRKYCSDYGVIVGRVSINNGFGVPNAKVSVFIPLDDVDKNNPLIKGLYPYEVISDKNSDGVRYNLLPKDGNMENSCSTPIGTFPNKREVLDNETILSVYCKYYQFTTTTNHAGDFMLFGVPLGQYTVHVDADISDIGIGSQRPYDLISQGTPSKLFYSPTKFNVDKNLDKLIQVKTMNSGVNVQPFWGDIENCEVGISRLDFDLNYTLRPAAIFMGSIYGDQHKHSINKRCRPRKKVGEMCEQIAGPGSVQMIRKTIEGDIEAFDVEGGRVIDDDGTWAYQIPMNLDYMVTDENGDLIPSQDPNKGVPTRARVRFNIGMDETGGEGRLRTRARYLVPNNPTQASEIDYEFGQETKDTSFRDLYWNKIYSVSNFISRFQTNGTTLPAKTRAITGMKDVDACAGDKTPFPFNKVDTNLNPIFFIICLIIKIIAFLIYIMNGVFIAAINGMISLINSILSAIASVINNVIGAANSLPGVSIATVGPWTIPYIACLTIKCPEDDAAYFAPGCKGGPNESQSYGFGATSPAPDYYPGDNFGHTGSILDFAAGLDNCIAIEMAKALNLFKFDFYNDWVNGTLFGFLLKYKKKKKNREVFCEFDCDEFTSDPNYTGVDGNDNGNPDNSCHSNYLLDTCYASGNNSQNNHYEVSLREGLIKKVGDELFYAATTHDMSYKLFPTDIISLGSVFDCDWQGIPKINDLLIPTTYKIPPDIQELNAINPSQVETCGMVNIGGSTGQLFFDIDCIGVHVDYAGCLNIRHVCEMGVDIDQAQEDINGNITIQSDCNIGTYDIDDDTGKWFRDVFFGLNNSPTPWIGLNGLSIPSVGYTTNFNLSNTNVYNFANASDNGVDYANFRGYSTDSGFAQPKHSYFFYFGLLPGKTALDKMNERFFTKCIPHFDFDLVIQSSSTIAIGSTGTITFTIAGGVGPYTYTVTGLGGPFTGSANPTATISGLAAGTYLITCVDSVGNVVTKTVIVSGPVPLYSVVSKIQNATTSVSNDGIIKITSIGGGTSPYFYVLKKFNGTTVSASTSFTSASIPVVLGGLPIDNTGSYQVIITDSSSPVQTISTTTGLTITGPNPISLTLSSSLDIACYGGATGELHLSATGGLPPYASMTTTGPAGYTSNALNMFGLIAGTYVTTIIDALGTPATLTTTLNQSAPLVMAAASAYDLAKQCDSTQYIIPFYITAGAAAGPINVEYLLSPSTTWTTQAFTYTNSTTPMYLNIPKADMNTYIKIRFSQPSTTVPSVTCYSNSIQINKTQIELPTVNLQLINATSTMQCTTGTASIAINIVRDALRSPISIEYSTNAGTTWTLAGSTSLVGYGFNVSVTSTNQTIYVRGTDNKGCQNTINFNVITPAANLSGSKSISGPTSLIYYTHTISATGGIGVKTSTPYAIGSTTDTTSTNPAITITDSVGCTITI